jgi:CheY-like chemotaxis protein
MPRNVNFRLDLQESLPRVAADAVQLQQLVMNLVLNAAEAIPVERRGTVLIMTRVQRVDAEYLDALGTNEIGTGDYVSLSVHDNGIGMDQATLSRIFDPFFTTKFTGRGLGLAAAAGIVRGHNGAMKVFSSPGQGTTFRVLFPVLERSAQEHELPVVNSRRMAGGEGLVLVIDDEPVVRGAAARALETAGYTVLTASSADMGVELLRRERGRIRVVILDVPVPATDAEESLDRLRAIDPGLRVVLSSGYSETDVWRWTAGKAPAGFLQKPYTAAALTAKVEAILRGAEESVV